MPTSTPSRPADRANFSGLLPPEAIQAARQAHGPEAEQALRELAALPRLPELAAMLSAESLGRLLTEAPLDLAQAASELAAMLPTLAALHALSLHPEAIGRSFARSLPSFMKGMRAIQRPGLAVSLAELDALVPPGVRAGLPRPYPEGASEAATLLSLLERLAGIHLPPPAPGVLPVGCEVEVPDIPGYPAGGAYALAMMAGLPLGEDELIEFSLPPDLGAAMQVRLIDALLTLGLLPAGQALSLHVTCETPELLAESSELAAGMGLISFALAFLWSADRRLSAGQIFKNFRVKRRGITGMRWPEAVGAEYRLTNVCTAASEPGVLGDAPRAHEAQIMVAAYLHAALIEACLGHPGPWARLEQAILAWVSANDLGELVARERNVTGELATLFKGKRSSGLQRELLALIEESGSLERPLGV